MEQGTTDSAERRGQTEYLRPEVVRMPLPFDVPVAQLQVGGTGSFLPSTGFLRVFLLVFQEPE